jgi:1-acyl-sn-glycerol-3-phosphate acyltransferase
MTRTDPFDRYSPRILALFGRYLRWYFRRHFNALRVAAVGPVPQLSDQVILYSNHPSWWDPIVLLLVAAQCFPGWRLFAPIDTAALDRYSILRRCGLFPIRPGSPSGARQFLLMAGFLLGQPRTALAVTAQGRLADQRERPIMLQPGVAHLLAGSSCRRAIPVAIEYVFWTERLPEVLLSFGSPIRARFGESTDALHRRLEGALQRSADELAGVSLRRDPREFQTILTSRRVGVGGVYDAYERTRSLVRGRRFDPEHRSLKT